MILNHYLTCPPACVITITKYLTLVLRNIVQNLIPEVKYFYVELIVTSLTLYIKVE